MPKYSIIIPAYNEEEYLPRCLGSILKQEYRDFEVIVVDNGSTDKTREAARKFTNKVYTCRTRGAGPAKNLGVQMAKGDIFCFVDADAIVKPKWLSTIDREFKKNKEVNAVTEVILYYKEKTNVNLVANLINSFFFLPLMAAMNTLGICIVSPHNVAIKKEIFNRTKGFPLLVQEHVAFSKELRKIKGVRISTLFCSDIYVSPRRFEKKGYIATMLMWIKGTFTKTKGDKYYYKN